MKKLILFSFALAAFASCTAVRVTNTPLDIQSSDTIMVKMVGAGAPQQQQPPQPPQPPQQQMLPLPPGLFVVNQNVSTLGEGTYKVEATHGIWVKLVHVSGPANLEGWINTSAVSVVWKKN